MRAVLHLLTTPVYRRLPYPIESQLYPFTANTVEAVEARRVIHLMSDQKISTPTHCGVRRVHRVACIRCAYTSFM